MHSLGYERDSQVASTIGESQHSSTFAQTMDHTCCVCSRVDGVDNDVRDNDVAIDDPGEHAGDDK